MQKKIIALAVAAAFSTTAFADVGFYGLVDATIASISAKGQKSDFLAVSGGASQSRVGVKATEDLGNGLTGVAVLEYGLDSQDNTTVGAARQKMVAVAGDFGTVATGYLQTAAYDFLAKYDPIYGSGSSAHSIVAAGHLVGSGAQRAQRAIAYISPNIGGMTFAANYATSLAGLGNLTVSDTSAAEKSTAYLLSANYAVDALSIGAVYAAANNGATAGNAAKAAVAAIPGTYDPVTNPTGTAGKAGTAAVLAKLPGASSTTSEFALAASYDLGVAKLMGTYQSSKSSVANSKANTVFSLAGVVPVETGAIAVMYAQNANADAANANSVSTSSVSATALTAGYLHTFTKSTTGYVVVSNVKNGSNTNAYSVSSNVLGSAGALSAATMKNGGSSTLFGIGLRKKF